MYRYKAGYDWQYDYSMELQYLLAKGDIDETELKFWVKEIRRMNEQDRNLWRKVRRNEIAVDKIRR